MFPWVQLFNESMNVQLLIWFDLFPSTFNFPKAGAPNLWCGLSVSVAYLLVFMVTPS